MRAPRRPTIVCFGTLLVIALLYPTPSRADERTSSEASRKWQLEDERTSSEASRKWQLDDERPPKLDDAAASKDHYRLAERPYRLGVEILTGGLLGAGFGIVFMFTAAGLCVGTGLGHDAEDGCVAPSLIAGATGALLGVPLGVYFGGERLKGDGTLGLTLAVGWTLGALGLATVVDTKSLGVFAGAVAAVFVGSILAYELTSDRNIANARRRRQRSLNLRPFVDRMRAGVSVFGEF